ncbi:MULTISPECIES: GlxA family transcriptional regulator [unclassified Mycobacterium]|uniref:GlxA family transcriptional regulator n=1 Tax=unclassified Mycobacterium TaxID=2642494 RepID=UPI0029C9491A|nr:MULTISPECIES: helix-turn-helix domain-containing protein [unclassified Mycobacterium]
MSKDFYHRVVAIVSDGSNPFEMSVATEFFGFSRPEFGAWYELTMCAPGGGARMREGLFEIAGVADIDAVESADTVIVPNRPDTEHSPHPAVLEAIRRADARGARLVSFCTGAFVLAAAGVLDGRDACTHWMWADAFRSAFPAVRLHPDVLYVADGRIFTAAGSAAAVDLCLHLVGIDHGREVANQVSRRLVYSGNRDGGQQQYISRPLPKHRDESLAPVLEWARGRLDAELDLPMLAAKGAVSVPTLHRRFRAELGCTPLQWITAQRVDLACRLVESTTLSMDAVAQRSGLGTAANLRAQMRRHMGVTPTAYRQRFGPRRAAAG